MRLRFITTILLLALALAPCVARTGHAAASQESRQFTNEDEREAKALAVRFVERLRETDDFGPLVSELFPADFAERIKQFVRDMGDDDDEVFFACDRDVLLRADAVELRRFYVAAMNFWNQQELLGNAAWEYAKLECGIAGKDAMREPCGWARHYQLAEEAVPEEVYRIARSDPLLDGLFMFIRSDRGDGKDADGEKDGSYEDDTAKLQAAAIRDLARLRAFTDKLERCIPLLRKGVEKLRSETKSLAAVHGLSAFNEKNGTRDGEEFRVYHLESETLEAGAFGLPAGALLVRARIYPYEMALTRTNGKLELLVVYPDFDGD